MNYRPAGEAFVAGAACLVAVGVAAFCGIETLVFAVRNEWPEALVATVVGSLATRLVWMLYRRYVRGINDPLSDFKISRQ